MGKEEAKEEIVCGTTELENRLMLLDSSVRRTCGLLRKLCRGSNPNLGNVIKLKRQTIMKPISIIYQACYSKTDRGRKKLTSSTDNQLNLGALTIHVLYNKIQ